MKRRCRRSLLAAGFLAALLCGAENSLRAGCGRPALAAAEEGTADSSGEDSDRGALRPAPRKAAPSYDEYGRVPARVTDEELALPDPVLDRTWPLPEPGTPGYRPPPKLHPEEDATDPLREESEPEIPARVPARPADAHAPVGALPPGTGIVGATPGAGPGPGPDTGNAEPLPSPLDQDDQKFDRESRDPEEW